MAIFELLSAGCVGFLCYIGLRSCYKINDPIQTIDNNFTENDNNFTENDNYIEHEVPPKYEDIN